MFFENKIDKGFFVDYNVKKSEGKRMNDPKAQYFIKTAQYDISYEEYNNFEKKYGEFAENGKAYIVNDKNTPRQWLNFLVNDNFGSVVANDGSGYMFYGMADLSLTKYYSTTDYLLRKLNGKRMILLTDKKDGKVYDLLRDCEDLKYIVHCGSVCYEGSVGNIAFSWQIFVPSNDCCECWILSFRSMDQREIVLEAAVDLSLHSADDRNVSVKDGAVFADTRKEGFGGQYPLSSVFAWCGASVSTDFYSEKADTGAEFFFCRATLRKTIQIGRQPVKEIVTAGGCKTQDKDCLAQLCRKYSSADSAERELDQVNREWEKIYASNSCTLPDKNLQYFLNYWLKNQIHLTMRYNRCSIMGYRDILQDTWGNLLVEPEKSKKWLLEALSMMHEDGRCPRQYDRISGKLDDRDFMDSPIWSAITLTDYVKETGDFGILHEKIGYYASERKDTVIEHVLRAYDYLYRARGKNGLLLMRDGDWLDGLTGINTYGEATTVWGTIAAFYGQNLLAELLKQIGDRPAAQTLKKRSAEYKEIVNRVGWDGNWYAYAFIDDEPIGANSCHEGKIYLNPQTWAIFSEIYNDQKQADKMYRSIHTYLATMYGPLLNAPAYKKYGGKCGRIQRLVPGTFSNSAVYLHAASFKVVADCACGRFDEALDTIQRILPNHSDSCDSRRTSEPYCVGNVYYGPEHPCFGMNLYTWFTATPSWLIHAGFENLLGVKAEYGGLRVQLRDIDGWNEYMVCKNFRGTSYTIRFVRSDEKGIWADGVKLNSNLITTDKKSCEVVVRF